MNHYEVFTDGYSTVIEADSLVDAIHVFNSETENKYLAIAVVQVNHPIYKEMV